MYESPIVGGKGHSTMQWLTHGESSLPLGAKVNLGLYLTKFAEREKLVDVLNQIRDLKATGPLEPRCESMGIGYGLNSCIDSGPIEGVPGVPSGQEFKPGYIVRELLKGLGEGIREARADFKERIAQAKQEAADAWGKMLFGPFWEISQIYGTPQKGEVIEMVRDPNSDTYVMKR